MELEPAKNSELVSLNPIRVETALSRYPVHRLAKKGSINIEISEENKAGDMVIKWEVSHNSKDGQPGPLAYKVDTLVVNRRIEETARPISRLIRLGSVREITEELGQTTHNDKIKNALHQNAGTYIKAKIRYRLADGTEKELEAGFTRYSVVFTGEKLPNGKKADAVYIVLNDLYMQVINGAITRPLDYDYLKTLPPGPQRFYEILSFQMYAAIKNDRPRAKLLYSEFCTYAPMMRHDEWQRVRSQMNKIHRPHFESGYIAKVDYQDTTDRHGNPDWIMFYQPGPKAKAEFRTFTKRGGPVTLEVEPFTADPLPQLPASEPPPLEAALIAHGITPAIAADLIRQHDPERIAIQIEHLDFLTDKKPGKVDDSAAWLVSAIKTNLTLPKNFVSQAERQRREEAKREKERQAAEERRRKQEANSRERHERELIAAHWSRLNKEEQATLDAEAIAQADDEDRKLIETGEPSMRRIGLQILRDKHIRNLLQADGTLPPAAE
jgi:hypothetical protein